MPIARIRVVFDPDSNGPVVVERDVNFSDIREPGGREFAAERAVSELEKEAIFGPYYAALPSVTPFMRHVKQTFKMKDFLSEAPENRLNTRAMWVEMAHTLLRARYQLAQARAYHDREQTYLSSEHSEAENLSWHAHLNKVESFNLAVSMLGKVKDLAARLVFERLGASLIQNLDRSKPEWERQVIFASVREGLENRKGNSYVASLSEKEYSELLLILDEFNSSAAGKRLWAYRLRLTHRISASIDRPELYTTLESRDRTPIKDASGKVTGELGSLFESRELADYSFLDLYADAVETLTHIIRMLERLEALPPFGLEAKAFAASLSEMFQGV